MNEIAEIIQARLDKAAWVTLDTLMSGRSEEDLAVLRRVVAEAAAEARGLRPLAGGDLSLMLGWSFLEAMAEQLPRYAEAPERV